MSMSFKVDEDLPRDIADMLRRAGFDAATVVEQKWGGSTDEALWPRIQREGRCLVTADKGFANAQTFPPGTHAGIVLFRLPKESRAGYIALAKSLIESGKLEAISGTITTISPDAIRIHRAS